MVTIRCTKKLLKRLKIATPHEAPASTTALGDWYGDFLFIGRRRIVLFVSDRSRLAVVVPGTELSSLQQRFREALSLLLSNIGTPAAQIEREINAMDDLTIGPTESRSVLGTMTEYGKQLRWDFQEEPEREFGALALELSEMICGPLGWKLPREKALELLATQTGVALKPHT